MKNSKSKAKADGLPHDRRAFTRVPYQYELIMKASNGESYVGMFHDISLKGMLFVANPLPPKGVNVTGTLSLGTIAVTLKGVVIQSQTPRGAAIQFKDLDVESFSHLRRLVALNMGDSDLIDEEFFASL